MLKHSHYDVVVIGGGPAGSTLSTFLVRKGYRVLVLEREKFPRFHVGESLLPVTQEIWERLGIAEEMQHLGNTFKYAGEFRLGKDPNRSEFDCTVNRFNNYPKGSRKERPYAYQVDRAEFDEFLLNHARSQGVTVVEEAVVKEVLWDGDRATGIRWKNRDGQEFETLADCVADCSGRHALISRSRKLLKPDPWIKTSAVFGQFKHVTRDPGIRQGYFNGYFIENGWVWFIPLHSDVMSVGVVMNKPGWDWWGTRSPEEILLTYINRYQFLRERFENAELFSKVRTLRGLPYSSTQAAGDGWILVGDANFFVDPLYSSGVQIAFHSADLAAERIDEFLSGNRDLKPFKRYEKWSRNYQFHVFTAIRIMYQLLRNRVGIESFVKATGKYSNNWDGFILRRVNAWGTGSFDDYHWALYAIWPGAVPFIALGKIREALGIPAWDTHQQFCTRAPLVIPRSAGLLGASKGHMPAKPASEVRDVNYLESWVVPMDSADEKGLPGALEDPAGDAPASESRPQQWASA